MDLEFLSTSQQILAKQILEEEGFDSNGCWIRFWDANSIQFDGDLTLRQLKTLVRILEAFQT